MAKRFKFKGEICVYCARQLATTSDHVFGRKFFMEHRRDNLPQVPACAPCNGRKAALEHYLMSVLPFGGRHADATGNLEELVPGRLEQNRALWRRLADGMSQTCTNQCGPPQTTTTVPFEPERLTQLLEFVAKGLAWHHWGVRIDGSADVWAGILNAPGEAVFKSFMGQNSLGRVEENLGEHTFSTSASGAPTTRKCRCGCSPFMAVPDGAVIQRHPTRNVR